jgi:hypothetical protein
MTTDGAHLLYHVAHFSSGHHSFSLGVTSCLNEGMTVRDMQDSNWFHFLEAEGQALVLQSIELYERELRLHSTISDYSFVVFPMAKAYEGFLKKFMYSVGMIDKNRYEHRQFRIGRSLNPDVSYHQRDESWLFDDISEMCSPDLARSLWDAWIEARNHLFHYFPDQRYTVSIGQAGALLRMMSDVMEQALACSAQSKQTVLP